jgi:hypothetical protein
LAIKSRRTFSIIALTTAVGSVTSITNEPVAPWTSRENSQEILIQHSSASRVLAG